VTCVAAPDAKPQPSPARRGLWLAMGLALVVRAGALFASPTGLGQDPDAYVQIGGYVWYWGVYGLEVPDEEFDLPPELIFGVEPTAIRTPLYPLAMTACVALSQAIEPTDNFTAPHVPRMWLIGGLHLACGLATVWLTWHLAGRWGVRSQCLAALAVACDPLLVNQSTLVMTETVATLLAVAWLMALTRLDEAVQARAPGGRAVLIAGVITGLAALCRPTFLPLAGVVTAALMSWAFVGRRSWPLVGLYVLSVSAVLAPWVLRNQWQFGRPIVATTHGGYTLLLGNNPQYYEHVRLNPLAAFDGSKISWHYAQLKKSFEFDTFSDEPYREPDPPVEVAADRAANDEAWGAIKADPLGFVLATLVRWQSLWRLMPMQINPAESAGRRTLRYLTGVWYGLEFALAGLGLYAVGSGCWRGSWRWGLLLILVFMAVHALYWTDMRMRAPLMPVIALAAAAGWDRQRQMLKRPGAIAAALPST
jgi:hypothetical protein